MKNKFRIIVPIGIILFGFFLLRGRIPHEKFDSNRWKTANLNLEANMTLRWDMMNDLRNKYKLVGMTKRQIVELLGNPGDTTISEYSYFLGYSKRGINTGRLTLFFDAKNIVTGVVVSEG